MKITMDFGFDSQDENCEKEMNLSEFEAWSGAVDTLKELTIEEMDILQNIIEEIYPEGLTETQLNDILWFEDEWISEMIGRQLYE